MKKNLFYLLGMVLLLQFPGSVSAQNQSVYSFDKKIPLPGDGFWDYMAIDSVHHHLFVSHGTQVDIIDVKTDQVIGTINGLQGIHGFAIADELHKGFISDGRANAVVAFDLTTFKKLATIPIEGRNPDAIVYDPFSKRIFTFNGGSNNSSVINARTLKVIGNIPLGGRPEFSAADGKGKIFNNLEDKSTLNVIDTRTMKVIKNYPLAPCEGPSGLAIDAKNERIFSGCNGTHQLCILNGKTGKIMTTIPIGKGEDAVAFDPSTRLIFSSNGQGDVTIIQENSPDHYSLIQTLKTQTRARTMAVDPWSHKIYLSLANVVPNTRKIIPNSFEVLVYKR
ncbi:MAG: YncE family protein [Chitinophagaceae bacterium]